MVNVIFALAQVLCLKDYYNCGILGIKENKSQLLAKVLRHKFISINKSIMIILLAPPWILLGSLHSWLRFNAWLIYYNDLPL